MSDKYLIVGLGNPGREYERTRHNVGFRVIDELVQRHQLSAATRERKALVNTGVINSTSVLLARPQTYMNLSGEAVRALLDYYKITPDHLIVVHDDMDTPFGTLKLRKQGGHGGQNGIRNILLHLGSDQFARVRFGIGRPPGRMRPTDYVLQGFSGDDEITAQQTVTRAVEAIENWLRDGIDLTMTRFNGDVEETSAPKPSLEAELAVAERAAELAPTDPKPLEALARLYRRAQQPERAVEMHLKLADLYARQDKLKPMLHEWDNAVRLRPLLTDLQRRMADTYEQLGDTKRATQCWLRLADTWQEQNDPQQALEAVEQALRVNPQHARALELQAALKQA